jgi:hypothetical protein
VIGAKFFRRLGRSPGSAELLCEVTDCRPYDWYSYRCFEGGDPFDASLGFERIDGGTRVRATEVYAPGGLLAGLVAPIRRFRRRRALAASLREARRLLEGS